MVTAGPWPRLATIPDDFPALLSETNWTMRLARIFLLCPLIDWVSVLVRCALPYRALPTVNAWARPGTSCGIACGSLVSGSRSSRRGFRGLSGGGRAKNRYELVCTLYTAPPVRSTARDLVASRVLGSCIAHACANAFHVADRVTKVQGVQPLLGRTEGEEGGNGARQHCSLRRLRALVRGWRSPRPVSVPEDRKGAMREGWRRQTGSSPQRLR